MDQCLSVTVNLQGDSGSTYCMTISRDSTGKILMRCGCPAGEQGTLCKHCLELLEGKLDRIKDVPDNQLSVLNALLNTPEFQRETKQYLEQMAELEARQNVLKKQLRALKKEFGRRLAQGI